MDMPPTRFRVVERGRRLEVIDTAKGAAPVSRESARPVPGGTREAPSWWPRRTRFDGTLEWTTHAVYDERAPRLVTLDPGRATWVKWAPPVMVLAAIAAVVLLVLAPWLAIGVAGALAGKKTRAQLRGWSTRMIDRLSDGVM